MSIRLFNNSGGYIDLNAGGDGTAANVFTLPAVTTTLVGTDATQTLTNKTLGSGLVAGASIITSGTAVASTSGTSIDFTDIPSWVKRITVMFDGVSTNGTSNILIQLGDSGGIETTGYSGSSDFVEDNAGGALYTTGFAATHVTAAAEAYVGQVIISNVTGNTWVASGVIARTGTAGIAGLMAGAKTLSDTLTQIRITTVTGTNTFDAGSINIIYE